MMANLDDVLRQLSADISELAEREAELAGDVSTPVTPAVGTKEGRRGSRFVGQHATEAGARRAAEGGRVIEPRAEIAVKAAKAGGLSGIMTKALAEATTTAGGWLVDPEVSSEIVEMIRARSVVMRMGPTRVQVKKSLAVTSISSGATATYVAENAAIPVSEQTFDQDLARGHARRLLPPLRGAAARGADAAAPGGGVWKCLGNARPEKAGKAGRRGRRGSGFARRFPDGRALAGKARTGLGE
jgi:HK97 family phage major capsid protein